MPHVGDDLQYRVNLSFEEAIFGAVHYNREATCKDMFRISTKNLEQAL